ncbi:sushi, von Willebrand factor type A, EGF and pentraxin domain-containing protein 1-like isoform X2 [Dreissena polymorpha]|uniref:sushi, von Willebrand factor type A, EGF and pentraxin domain-containing protein 1-like isoform X2 n=1 Tax=Dreissena polymorpha TaxID=45954 RepID=UPI0022653E60|nr:sushi, von Willebrand factor type A, EGF and pentraxin domain-containing protein 1-like isoform X2 [Dreissena polymorpha]
MSHVNVYVEQTVIKQEYAFQMLVLFCIESPLDLDGCHLCIEFDSWIHPINYMSTAVYAQMGNKRMTISYGYVVNSINVAIDSQSMIECAVQCQRQSRKNSCQVAGYNTASRRCQISFASSQDVSPTGDQADVILNMFDAPCPIVPDLLHGNMSSDGNIVRFTCNADFVINGVDTLRCVSGVWNGTYPTCERITTTTLTTMATTTTIITTTANTPATTTTPIGTTTSTTITAQPLTTTTLATATHSAPCSTLSAPGNGTIENNGNVMTFKCNQGYVLNGEPALACLAGSWNGTAPLCFEAPCDPLPSPNNGNVSTTSKVATFTCNSNNCLYGSQTRVCSLGQWNGSETLCVQPGGVCANEEYLVTGPNGVPDSSITVSSQYFEPLYPGMQIYAVSQARLNASLVVYSNGSFLSGVWASNNADLNQSIQVRFPTPRMVTAVTTRGRKKDGVKDDHGQKVTSYHVYYSTDCSTFYPYKNATSGQILVTLATAQTWSPMFCHAQ